MEIRSADGRTAVSFETESTQADRTPRQTELVFNKIGGQYFLSQIWMSGSNSGALLEESKVERKLEAAGVTSERHSVAARHKLSKTTKQAENDR